MRIGLTYSRDIAPYKLAKICEISNFLKNRRKITISCLLAEAGLPGRLRAGRRDRQRAGQRDPLRGALQGGLRGRLRGRLQGRHRNTTWARISLVENFRLFVQYLEIKSFFCFLFLKNNFSVKLLSSFQTQTNCMLKFPYDH